MQDLVDTTLLATGVVLVLAGLWLVYQRLTKLGDIDKARVGLFTTMLDTTKAGDSAKQAGGLSGAADRLFDVLKNVKDQALSVALVLIALGLLAMAELIVSLKVGG